MTLVIIKPKRGPTKNPENYMTLICIGCGISFECYKSKYKLSKTKILYHSRDCFIQNNKEFKGNPNRRHVYLDYYRCRTCNKFIKKTDARMHTTPSGNRTYPVCSNENCGNYPLQTKPRNKKIYFRVMQELEQQPQKKELEPVLEIMK